MRQIQFLKSTVSLIKKRPILMKRIASWETIQWEMTTSLQVLMPNQVHLAIIETTKTYSTMMTTIQVQPILPLSHANPMLSSTPRIKKCCMENRRLKSEKWPLWLKWWQQSPLLNLLKSSSLICIRHTSKWAKKHRKQLELLPTLSKIKWSQSTIFFMV